MILSGTAVTHKLWFHPELPHHERDLRCFDHGDITFVIFSAALVSFMVPGLAFLYTGLVRRKSALSLIWIVYGANAVVIFQWFLCGYSLAFSTSARTGFIGNLAHMGLRGVLANPAAGSPLVPDLLFSFLQMQFAAVTVCIWIGAAAERGRVAPAMVFSFLWCTFVYCPLAYWAWGANGWAFTRGVIDFSGGGPVEIGSGVAALAYSMVLGRRQDKEASNFRPHNVSMVALGTGILWFGWIGFNAGSAFGANMRAVVAAWNSFLCATIGGMTWCLIDFRMEKKYSMVSFCCGAISGLIAATPSSGCVPPWSSLIIGVAAGAVCNYATRIKYLFRIDDSLDVFAQHAIGGILGLLANGIFGDANIIALDGVSSSQGGWLNRNWKQMYLQVAYIGACSGYTFIVTALLAKVLNMIPGLRLRADPEGESIGMDEDQIGEFAADYIESQRHYQDGAFPRLREKQSMQDTLSTKTILYNNGYRETPSASLAYIKPVEFEKGVYRSGSIRSGSIRQVETSLPPWRSEVATEIDISRETLTASPWLGL